MTARLAAAAALFVLLLPASATAHPVTVDGDPSDWLATEYGTDLG